MEIAAWWPCSTAQMMFFGTERRVAPEEYPGAGRLEGGFVHLRDLPLVELDTQVPFDPREGVFLSDRQNDIVCRQEFLSEQPFRGDAALGIDVVLHPVEQHARQSAVLDHEGLGSAVDDDLDAFFLGVIEFPGRGLEKSARLACHDFHALGAEPQAGTATIHCRVTDADDQHAFADLLDMSERHGFEPGNADVDVRGAGLTARELQFLALGRAGAHEDGVEPSRLQQLAHARNRVPELQIDAPIRDLGDFLVQHGLWQAERGDIGAHQAAGDGGCLEYDDFIAQRHKIIRHRQRRAARTDAGDTPAVLELRHRRQERGDIVAQIGGNPLESADGDGLLLDATPPASRLAGTIAYATEDSREDIRVAIHHVGLGESAFSDQADVFRDIGVGRTGPLAINDSMIVVGIRSISWFHSKCGWRRSPLVVPVALSIVAPG